jgi:myo-inositol-1(or 4)-monophosphatase
MGLEEARARAEMLARAAGEIARRGFVRGIAQQLKDDASPVTEIDLAINRLVIETLIEHYPEYGILGEEESRLAPGQTHLWVCDPLDGTIPFAHGLPTSAFSLALVVDGKPQVAVAYDFHLDRMLTAVRGHGTRLNGEPVAVSSAPLRGSVVDMEGIWTRALPGAPGIDRLPHTLEAEGARGLKIGSTVYAGMLVATGQIGALVTRGDKPWDIAAITLLVEEAGGTVTDLSGTPVRCDGPGAGAIFAPPHLHASLLAAVHRVA